MAAGGKRGGAERPASGRSESVATGVADLVRSTVMTALAGARDVGAEIGHAAAGAVRGSIRAAGQIGGDVARLASHAAEGTLDAADRISTVAGRAASNLVNATVTGVAEMRRRPLQRADGRPAAAAERSQSRPARPARRAPKKPLAKHSTRVSPAKARSRRRRAAAT